MSAPTREEVEAFITALKYGMKVQHKPEFLIALAEGWLENQKKPQAHADVSRMNWLEGKTVEVRTPLVYGSHHLFWSEVVSEDHEEHVTDLRRQIDEAILKGS